MATRRIAIVVAVDHYPNALTSPPGAKTKPLALGGAKDDLKRSTEMLVDCGYEVFPLTQVAATKSAVMSKLTWASGQANQAGDSIVLYFSGCGSVRPGNSGELVPTLATYDWHPTDFRHEIGIDDLESWEVSVAEGVHLAYIFDASFYISDGVQKGVGLAPKREG
jgi:Caspase domain